ncbi:hypothetical protein JCM3775_006734 [Rhodotorula graminis]
MSPSPSPPVGDSSSSPPPSSTSTLAPAIPTVSSAPVDTAEPNGAPAGDSASSSTTTPQPDVPTPLSERSPSAASAGRPIPPARSASYMADGWKASAAADVGSSSTGSSRSFAGQGQDNAQRTTRAASDGAILATASAFASLTAPSTAAAAEPNARAAGGTSSRLSSLGSSSNDDGAADEQAFYREHQRRSLVDSASQRLSSAASKSAFSPPLASARLAPGSAASSAPFFAPPVFVPAAQQQQQQQAQSQRDSSSAAVTPSSSSFPTSSSALLSPTSTSPPSSAFSGEGAAGPPGSKGATLHLGDLDVWMDEAYVRECCALMGWDAVSAIKMSRGASPASGYCFLTFPTTADAQRALQRFNSQPPMLMPRSGRTFKLNWGTGLPGLQPRWDGEFSVFVGDLAREVGEADLMTLFTPLFPSTKSAKVMCDPSTGLSRGYGFVRFTDESDMARALRVGANAHSGLLLHGRTIRISEASGPGSSAAANAPPAVEGMSHLRERTRTRSGEGHFAAQQQQQSGQQSGPQQQQAPPQAQGYFPPYPTTPLVEQPFPDHHSYASPALASTPYGHPSSSSSGGGPAASYPSPLSPYGGPPPPLGGGLGGSAGAQSMASPGLPRAGARDSSTPQVRAPIPQGAVPPGGDPNNTTVFVGGLPACISEETLKSFFHHFGEITYCKIPPGKGCGFVQFVRRQDAELAIAKMNDFPIHGKSRIRLSWGRSQGDKQVEHVRKLASALGVPFDAVWRMVQGQDNSTIKQIASAVGTNGSSSSSTGGGSSPPQQHQQQSRSVDASLASRMDLRAVANAAGLSESEVLDLVKNGNGFLAAHPLPNHSLNGNGGGAGAGAGGNGGNVNGGSSHSNSTASSDFFARSSAVTGSATSLESNAGGASGSAPSSGAEGGASRGPGGPNPYSRVSPSSFSSAFGAQQQQGAANHHQPQQQQQQHVVGSGGMFPMSPPPTAGPANGGSSFAHHQSQHPAYPQQSMPVAMHHSPYTAIRPESYLVQPPTQSPYERVDFADGGRPSPNGFMPGPPSQQQQHPHAHPQQQQQHGHGLPHGGHGGTDRYQPQGFGFPGGASAGKWHEQPHVYDGSGAHYGHHGGSSLDDSFSSLHLGGQGQGQGNGGALVGSPPGRSLPPPVNANSRHAFTPTAPDFFPGALASPTTQGAGLPGGSSVGEANWSWGGVSAA